MLTLPLAFGTKVEPYGEISAVLWTGGERYYLLSNGEGDAAMIPAFIIEPECATMTSHVDRKPPQGPV